MTDIKSMNQAEMVDYFRTLGNRLFGLSRYSSGSTGGPSPLTR